MGGGTHDNKERDLNTEPPPLPRVSGYGKGRRDIFIKEVDITEFRVYIILHLHKCTNHDCVSWLVQY
jgi:hypothetical protein